MVERKMAQTGLPGTLHDVSMGPVQDITPKAHLVLSFLSRDRVPTYRLRHDHIRRKEPR